MLYTFFLICLFTLVFGAEKDAVEGETAEMDEEKLEYARGSVCRYCEYCKFCKLCDKDCPCEASASKPNCKMCKYCKYCYLCSAACNTFCKPGGIVDKVSAAILNSLPFHDQENIDKDIDSVKQWIDKKKDEL